MTENGLNANVDILSVVHGTVMRPEETRVQIDQFRGPAGVAGPAGRDGRAATVQIGTVTTLPAGANAVVINSGTETDAILDFGIPQGAPGSGGGSSGGAGEAGEDGGYYIPAVSSDGTLSWSATKESMPSVAPRNIAGPAGPKGDTGDKGADGKTPARGTDYWTAADIAEIKGYVDDAILGGAW